MLKKTVLTGIMVLITFILFFECGCNSVRRRLTITSEPEGATVYLNDREIGKTPISQNIIYSGTYKVRCSKDSYATQTVMHDVRSPWYLWPGVDFISENFVPGEICDQQSCHIVLQPERMIPAEELLENANQLRNEAQNNGTLQSYQNVPFYQTN